MPSFQLNQLSYPQLQIIDLVLSKRLQRSTWRFNSQLKLDNPPATVCMSRCLNCCHKRRWRALHTFVEAFQGCYKGGVTGGWDFRSMSGICMFFRFIVVIVNYHIVHQIGWLLRAMMVLSLSMLILIVQPYKKSYMNVLDTLLLALL